MDSKLPYMDKCVLLHDAEQKGNKVMCHFTLNIDTHAAQINKSENHKRNLAPVK